MNTLQFIGIGLFFILVFLSGYRLRQTGKPYGTITLTIHKIIGLVVIIFIFIIISKLSQAVRIGTVELIAYIVSGLIFLSTIITGGLMSLNKEMPSIILIMHRVLSYLTVISTVIVLYIFLNLK